MFLHTASTVADVCCSPAVYRCHRLRHCFLCSACAGVIDWNSANFTLESNCSPRYYRIELINYLHWTAARALIPDYTTVWPSRFVELTSTNRCSTADARRRCIVWRLDDHVTDVCRLRRTDTGSVLAERAGQGVACQVCPVFRVQVPTDRQVLLAWWSTVLPRRFLQVSPTLRLDECAHL